MKEIKNKNIVSCPKCEQEAIMTTVSAQILSVAIIFLLSFGVAVWVPIVGWICAPIMMLIGIILLIVSLIAKIQGSATIVCKECNSKFKITKEEYKKMKSN